MIIDKNKLKIDYSALIGQGRFSHVYRGKYENLNVAVKLFNKPEAQKKLKYYLRGIFDHAKLEYKNYLHALEIFRPFIHFFAKCYGFTKIANTSVLITELIVNEDGNVAKSIKYYKSKIPEYIVTDIINFIQYSIEKSIPLFDPNENNFLLKIENGRFQLKIIDYDSLGSAAYWPEIYLLNILRLDSVSKRNRRRFNRSNLSKIIGRKV